MINKDIWPYNLICAIFGECNVKAASHTWDIDINDAEKVECRLNYIMLQLDWDHADLLRLRFKDGMAYKDIASKYNISVSGARYRVSKAISKISHPSKAVQIIAIKAD